MQTKYSGPQSPATCQADSPSKAPDCSQEHRPTKPAAFIFSWCTRPRNPSVGTELQSSPLDLACPYLFYLKLHNMNPFTPFMPRFLYTPIPTVSCSSFPSLLNPAQNCKPIPPCPVKNYILKLENHLIFFGVGVGWNPKLDLFSGRVL